MRRWVDGMAGQVEDFCFDSIISHHQATLWFMGNIPTGRLKSRQFFRNSRAV